MVYMNGIPAGVLTEVSPTEYLFRYEDAYYADAAMPAVSLTLPKTQQEIIRLSKLEMLNNQEIAEKLNYSEQTVKNQLSMGLKQLRQLISNRTNLMWLLFLV
mgnify:CR=1 FL=1